MDKTKVIAVVGPTGIGKTTLAIDLAKELDGEIISADSMQVYRKMDIGTAKATEVEQSAVRHHLIDIQDYDQPWNVKSFQEKCRECIEEIHQRKKAVILCGGTGLYVKAALYDYVFEDEVENPQWQKKIEAMSNEELVALLQKMDPACLDRIHPNNRKRLLRAAFIAGTGNNKSKREQAQKHEPLYDLFLIGLQADKTLVDERIDLRVDEMFEQGLAEEACSLFKDSSTWDYTSFQGIGYKEFKAYFLKEDSLEEVKEKIKLHSRQYAKRQMTWFRNQMPVHWYHPENREQIFEEVKEWYA